MWFVNFLLFVFNVKMLIKPNFSFYIFLFYYNSLFQKIVLTLQNINANAYIYYHLHKTSAFYSNLKTWTGTDLKGSVWIRVVAKVSINIFFRHTCFGSGRGVTLNRLGTSKYLKSLECIRYIWIFRYILIFNTFFYLLNLGFRVFCLILHKI